MFGFLNYVGIHYLRLASDRYTVRFNRRVSYRQVGEIASDQGSMEYRDASTWSATLTASGALPGLSVCSIVH